LDQLVQAQFTLLAENPWHFSTFGGKQAKHEQRKETMMVAWSVWHWQGECNMSLGVIKAHLLHHMASNQASPPSYIFITSLLHLHFIWPTMLLINGDIPLL